MIWHEKAPGETRCYEWRAPDVVQSYSLTETGVTIAESESSGPIITVLLSGGSAGTTGNVVIEATTSDDEIIRDTVYIPITNHSSAFSETVDEIIAFALKPVVGLGRTAKTAEVDDALEWLNGLLAQWKEMDADVGAAIPLGTSDVIYAPDAWILAIKNSLRVVVAEQYGRQVAPTTAMLARQGLQIIRNAHVAGEPVEAF